MTILVITAEAWDLGMSQPPLRVASMTLVALLGTSFYIVWRQQLLQRRRRRRLGEQRVISNVSISLAVLIGMLTTYGVLFVVTLLLTQAFFGPLLVEGWAASLEGQIYFGNYLRLAGFVAALGIIIGALGASFEEQGYFRHVAYVNEET
jgi:ABC-type Fe3+ transport system permease subunit